MSNDLRRLLEGAVALQAATGLDVVLIGGVARGAWASPRATQDVDVLVGSSDLTPIVDAADQAGLLAVAEEVEWMARADMTRLRLPEQPHGPVRLDIVAAVHPFYDRVVARSRLVEVFDMEIRVACPEDLILLKLLADRPRDRADIRALLRAQPDLDWEVLRDEADRLELELPEPPG